MSRTTSSRVRPLLACIEPAWFTFASAIAGANALLEEGRGAESFTIGLLHDLLGLHTQARRHDIHECERPDRMTEAEAARGVEILRRGNPFLDKYHRLDHEGVQHTIDGEAGDILYADWRLANIRHRAHRRLDGRFRRIEAWDNLDELHARDWREIMGPDEIGSARDRQFRCQRRDRNRRGI